MKVDGNSPTTSILRVDVSEGAGVTTVSKIPIRLEIAARLLAGRLARSGIGGVHTDAAKTYLEIADALIAVHNDTCE